MQREMPMLGAVSDLPDVPVELLKVCDDERDAIRLCIQMSGYTNEFIGKKLGIDKGHFSRVMSNSAGFPTHKRIDLMRLCNNRAPVQYEIMRVGSGESDVYKARISELQEELDAVKGALSAVLGAAKTAETRLAA
jgi:hypothetical protein